jgi:hypothetical protein
MTKNVSILHLKSSNNDRPNYFPTSTFSKHNPHLHNWPITGRWLLRWRVLDMWFVLTWCPFKLSLVFNSYIHFSNMRCVLLIKLYKVLMICMDTLILTVIVYGVQCFHISAAYCYGRKNQYWLLVPGLVLGKQTSRSKGLFSILWCTGDHPQEELAKFGYVLTTYVTGNYRVNMEISY